ncbi:hypothetical protein NIB75_19035 [Bacteroides uniformis]|nr:hypothetical protein [Bacteroides uniformis]
MALGNVFIKDVDGNIPYDTGSSGEKVTGLLFDVSLQPTLFTEGYGKTNETRLKPGDVCYITSFKSAVNDFGIIERVEATDEEEMNVNFLHGIPAYHIREFFRMSGNPGGSVKTLRDVRGLFGELGCAGNHAACCRGYDQPDRHMDGTAAVESERRIGTIQPQSGKGAQRRGRGACGAEPAALAHPFRQSFQYGGGYD